MSIKRYKNFCFRITPIDRMKFEKLLYRKSGTKCTLRIKKKNYYIKIKKAADQMIYTQRKNVFH